MKTRFINCAKVTRETWPELDKPANKILGKIRGLIKKSAPAIVEKHATMTIKDKPAEGKKLSSLDLALTKLRKKGVRVLDFWRGGDGWEIKTMVAL